MKVKNKFYLFIASALLGILFRFVATTLSPQIVDVDSFYLVGELVASGKNIYIETTRYNYGPLWSYFCGLLFIITKIFQGDIYLFRMFNTVFLSIIDVLLAYLLYKHISFRAGIIYLFNPVSVILTGTHGQFDVIPIYIGLWSAIVMDKAHQHNKYKILSLVLLSLSLIFKHIFIILPFWWALKESKFKWKIIILISPLIIYLTSFLPYILNGGLEGIVKNVFKYHGYLNTFFHQLFIPFPIQQHITSFGLFIFVLIIIPWFIKKQTYLTVLLIYTSVLVIFSPTIHNQYFTIVLPIVSIFPNGFFFAFIVSHLFLHVISALDLVIYVPVINLPLTGSSVIYFPFITFLFAGLIFFIIKQKIIFLNIQLDTIKTYILVGLLVSIWIIFARTWEYSTIHPIEKNIKKGNWEQANKLFNEIHKNPPLPNTLYYHLLKPSWNAIEINRMQNPN